MNGLEFLRTVGAGVDEDAVSATGVVFEEAGAVVDVAVDNDPGGVFSGSRFCLVHGSRWLTLASSKVKDGVAVMGDLRASRAI